MAEDDGSKKSDKPAIGSAPVSVDNARSLIKAPGIPLRPNFPSSSELSKLVGIIDEASITDAVEETRKAREQLIEQRLAGWGIGSERERAQWAKKLADSEITEFKAALTKPALAEVTFSYSELGKLTGIVDKDTLSAALDSSRHTRIDQFKKRFAELKIGDEGNWTKWAEDLVEAEISEAKRKYRLAESGLPEAIVEARNLLRQRIVGIRQLLEAYRKLSSESSLSLAAVEMLRKILERLDKIETTDHVEDAVEIITLERNEEGGWIIKGAPILCGDWNSPGVRFELPDDIADSDYHEGIRSALRDASPGVQYVVIEPHAGGEVIKRWAWDEEVAFFSEDEWSVAKQGQGNVLEVLGIARAVLMYLKALKQLIDQEQAILRTQEWLINGREQQQGEDGAEGAAFDAKDRIKFIRTRLECDMEVSVKWLVDEERKRMTDAKIKAEEVLRMEIDKYEKDREKLQDTPPPLLRLHCPAGQKGALDDLWILDREGASQLLARSMQNSSAGANFSLEGHVQNSITNPELERLGCNQLTVEKFAPESTNLAIAAETVLALQDAYSGSDAEYVTNAPSKFRKGWDLLWRKLFLRYPSGRNPINKPDNEPAWAAPPAAEDRGTVSTIMGMLKEAAAAPMKVLGPILGIFAILTILGLPNLLKQATKGIGEGLVIPDGFFWMFLLATGLTVSLIVAAKAAWRYRSAEMEDKSSWLTRLPFVLVVVFGVLLGLGLIPRKVQESVTDYRQVEQRAVFLNGFLDDPDVIQGICLAWFRQLRVFHDELMLRDLEGGNVGPGARGPANVAKTYSTTAANDALATDSDARAIEKTVNRWRALESEFDDRLKANGETEKLRSVHKLLAEFVKELEEVEKSKQPLDIQKEKISEAAWKSGVHPFQEMLWWRLNEIMRATNALTGINEPAFNPGVAIKFQRGLRSLDGYRTNLDRRIATLVSDKENATDDSAKKVAEEQLLIAEATKGQLNRANGWFAIVKACDPTFVPASNDEKEANKVDYRDVRKVILGMSRETWEVLSGAAIDYRGGSFSASWTLGALPDGSRPIGSVDATAAAQRALLDKQPFNPPAPSTLTPQNPEFSSLAPSLADLDFLRRHNPALGDNADLVNRAKRSASVISLMIASADMTDSLKSEDGDKTETNEGSKSIDWREGNLSAAWVFVTIVLFGIASVVIAGLLWCAARAADVNSAEIAWRTALFLSLASLCAWGIIWNYHSVAASNDSEYRDQRLINGLTTLDSFWKDDTYGAWRESPYALLIAERVRAITDEEKVHGVEVGPRSEGRPLKALGVFIALVIALSLGAYSTWNEIKRKRNAAVATAMARAKQQALTEYFRNVDAQFKEWNTQVEAKARSWINHVLRNMEMLLEEEADTRRQERRKKTTETEQARACLEGRGYLLKELNKCTSTVQTAAHSLRNIGVKTLKS